MLGAHEQGTVYDRTLVTCMALVCHSFPGFFVELELLLANLFLLMVRRFVERFSVLFPCLAISNHGSKGSNVNSECIPRFGGSLGQGIQGVLRVAVNQLFQFLQAADTANVRDAMIVSRAVLIVAVNALF